MDKIKCRNQMNLRVLHMWAKFADGGACVGEVEKRGVTHAACLC
jgi:hypothetical protein